MPRIVPIVLGTVGTDRASLGDFPGMSEVFPAFLGTVRTGILEGLTSGTSRDVPSSPSFCWDCQDWDSRGASIWDFLGCPK